MECNHCGQQAEWVENKEVYGKNYGSSYMIWLCRPCDAYVGCHKNTKEPKGRFLAKKELRDARKRAHAVVDPIWQSGQIKRKEVYKRLSQVLGLDVHIGDTKTPQECDDIILVAKLSFTPNEQ